MTTLKSTGPASTVDYCYYYVDEGDLVSGDGIKTGNGVTHDSSGSLIGTNGFITGTGGTSTDCSFIAGVASFSAVAIVQSTSIEQRAAIFEGATDKISWAEGYSGGGNVFAYFSDSTYVAQGDSDHFVVDTEAAHGITLDYAGSPQAEFWKDGTSVHSNSLTGASTVTPTPDNNEIWIGGYTSGSNSAVWNGYIKLLAIWVPALTASQMATLTADPEGELFQGDNTIAPLAYHHYQRNLK